MIGTCFQCQDVGLCFLPVYIGADQITTMIFCVILVTLQKIA